MNFNHTNIRGAVEEDRLSSLPDDIIHKILSSFDMKFVVQTCSLSSRWKLLWTTMTCLNFSTDHFRDLHKFDEFVTHVLSHRNHQIEMSSVKVHFRGAVNMSFLEKIASYAFSHNIQYLTIDGSNPSRYDFDWHCPPCVFSSRSLKQFTLSFSKTQFWGTNTTITRLDFPALTTLNLSYIKASGDIFSKCVNLKNLTLENFRGMGGEDVFDIITPRLSNLTLIDGDFVKAVNMIAPELENLIIIRCSIKYFNAPPGLSSLCYRSRMSFYESVLQFSNDRFHSLNKVTIGLYFNCCPYTKELARKTISMLQKLHSARHVTLDWEMVECISSFPDLLSRHPSPFSNLICLTIDCSRRNYVAYEVKMSTKAKNFLLENSPKATFIMELPEVHLSE